MTSRPLASTSNFPPLESLAWTVPVVLVPTLLAAPLLAGKVFLFRDLFQFIAPQQELIAHELASGRLPEWNPFLYSGAPLLAEPGTGVFYLPNLLFQILDPLRAGTLFVLLHLPLAALGSYSLARHLGADGIAASVGALAYANSGYVLSLHGSHYYLAGAAWLPLAVLGLLLSSTSPLGRRWALGALPIAAMVLNGEFQSVGFAGLSACLLRATRGARDPWPWVRLLSATALGCGIGAVQLLPSALFATQSVRQAGIELAESGSWSTHPLRWLEFFVALPFGAPYPEHNLWTPGRFDSSHRIPWALSMYVGALTLAAMTALRRDRTTLAIATLVALGIILAAGQHTPLFELWHRAVPGAKFFRYAEKYLLLATLGFALAAALGLTRLHLDSTLRSRAATTALVLAAVMLIAAGAASLLHDRVTEIAASGLRATDSMVDPNHAASSLWLSLARAGALLMSAGLLLALSQRRPGLLAPGLLLIALADFAGLGMRMLSYGEAGFADREPPLANAIRQASPAGTTGRFYRHPSCNRVLAGDSGAASGLERQREHDWLSGKPNTLSMARLGSVVGYGAAESALKHRAWTSAARAGLSHTLRVFGASVMVACDGQGHEPAARTLAALPRAFVAKGAASATLDDILDRLRDPLLDWQAQVLVEGPAPTAGTGGTAEVGDISPTHVRVNTSGSGTMVLLDSAGDGWEARLDGNPVPIMRAFALYRAVEIPGGEHTVDFVYRTPGLAIGALVSLLSTLTAGLLIVLARRQANSREPHQAAGASLPG